MGLVAFAFSNIWFALETADEEHSISNPDVLLANPTLLKTVGISLVAILLGDRARHVPPHARHGQPDLDQWAICLSFRSPCWSSPRDASSWASAP